MNDKGKFEQVIERVLKLRPDLTRERIIELVNEKKKQVGSTYLTDLGALYLVLYDLGVRLEEEEKYITVDSISAPFNRVSVEGYLLGHRKYEGRTVFYLAYNGRAVRGVFWGEGDPFEGLRPLELVRISRASVRSGRDGFEVHVKDEKGIAGRGQAQDPSSLAASEAVDLGVYAGVIEGPLRQISYRRKDSSEGRGVSFTLRCQFGSMRAVVWDPPEELQEGYEAVLGPLKRRRTEYGDELSSLDVVFIAQRPPRLYVVWRGPEHAIAEDRYGGIRPVKLVGECEGNVVTPRSIKVEFPWQTVEVERCESGEERRPTITKISNATRGFVNVEFIVLSEPELNGSRYELLIGDDTGEAKLVVPQQRGDRIKGISIGERVLGLALSASEGSLVLGQYSVLIPRPAK